MLLSKLSTNKEGFTKRQIWDANREKRTYSIGCPPLCNYKAHVNSNMLWNFPVTIEDINAVEQIYGPDVYGLKGKTVCKTSPVTKKHVIQILMEIKEKE